MEVNGHQTARQEDDYRLVLTAKNGCQDAYARLHDRYRQPIFQFMLQRVKNPEDAQDLTMEAFEKAFLRLNSYTPTHAFSTWLFKIALNNLIDFTRKKQPAMVRLGEVNDEPGIPSDWLLNYPSNILTPEETMMQEQRILLVQRLMGQLDERYRRMIELRYYEEMSYDEIANHLNIPIGTVKAQLFRAKENLYEMLQTPQAQAHLEQTARIKV